MSDNVPGSPDPAAADYNPARALFGAEGPINGGPGDARTRAVIESGIAKPSLLSGSEPAARAPARDPAATFGGRQPEAFDPAKVTLPDGFQRDEAFDEFASVAKSAGLNNENAAKLVDLHAKAIKGHYEAFGREVRQWEEQSRQELGGQLPEMTATIRDRIGSDQDAARTLQLLDYYGLGSNVSVLRTLYRLATGGRRY